MDKIIATSPNNPLLSKLLLKQGEQSDYAFAKRLGIKRSLYQFVRTGRLPIGITLLKAIVQTYPELNADVLDYLRRGDHDNSD